MATNVQQAQLRGRYQQIIDHDRGRLMHLRRMTQIILQWQIHLALNIQHPRSIVANYFSAYWKVWKVGKEGLR